MTEKQYKELLKTLSIGINRSNMEAKELLEAKLNEYLDRTDVEAEQMVSDIQDALDYVEELIDKMGSGIALASTETDKPEEINQDLLNRRTDRAKGAISYTSSPASSGNTTVGNGSQGTNTSVGASGTLPRHPWFYSISGDKNVDDMFMLAESDLQQGDYKHAESIFDTILRTEVVNAGAYLGKVLAKYNLQEPKDLATCYTQGLENDSDLKRAESCGNDKQKKFIQDALEERRKAMIYIEADKVLNTSADATKLLDAAKEFEGLGSYRDASQKANACKDAAKKVEDDKQKRENERKKQEKKRKREARRKRNKKRVTIGIIALIVYFAAGVLLYKGTSGSGAWWCGLFPNFVHTGEMHITHTHSPFFVSFAPLDSLWISDSARNMETVVALRGADRVNYQKAMKKVTIPKNAKEVEINCARLKSLEIPDGVVSLRLYNISSELTELKIPDSVQYVSLHNVSEELAKNIVFPSSLVTLQLGEASRANGSDMMTNEAFRNLELPDSLQYLNIHYCDLLTEIEIDKPVNDLMIRAFDTVQSVQINSEIQNVFLSAQSIEQLTISGDVENLYARTVEKCSFGNDLENLDMEYSGLETLLLPQDIKNAKIFTFHYEDTMENFTYPETAENIQINHYVDQKWQEEHLVGDFSHEVSTFENFEQKVWPQDDLDRMRNEAVLHAIDE